MKKIISIVMVIVLCAFVFTACTEAPAVANKTEAPKADATSEPAAATPAVEASAAPEAPAVSLPDRKGLVAAVAKMPSKPLKLAFLGYKNNAFWLPVEEGVLAAKDYLKNFNVEVEYIVMGPEINAETCVAAIETTIAKKYDGFAIVPINDGTFEYMNKAVDAGIPVVSVTAEGTEKAAGTIQSKALAFLGTDAYASGQLAGKTIAELMHNEGKLAVIAGTQGAPQHEARKRGALDYLKENCPNIKVVGEAFNNDDTGVASEATKQFLAKDPDIKVIYGCAGGAHGAAEAIKDLGLLGKVGLVCYDHIPENIDYARQGYIWAALDQKPYEVAFNSLVYLYNNIVAGELPPVDEDGNIMVEPTIMTPDNVNQLYPQ